MRSFLRDTAARLPAGYLLLAIAIAAAPTGELLAGDGAASDNSLVAQGRTLFTRQWQPNDERTPAGDGLGPMFNARSCVDCHSQGGVGGSGAANKSVDLLCLIPPQRITRVDRRKFVAGVKKIHPGFVTNPTTAVPMITLHKFGVHPAYDKWRVALEMLVDLLPEAEVPDRIALAVFRRRTPSLFGAGLIDSIPREVLDQMAQKQARGASPVRGRVGLASDGGAGKFGWRGQTSSLKRFILGACANELGLQVPSVNQAVDPLEPDHKSTGLDLDQQQCDALVAFVASLPAPVERSPMTPTGKELRTSGEKLFRQVGCAECHPARLGHVAGIYSDLLLHDMGSDLADPAAANSPGVASGLATVSMYYGGSADIFVAVPPEAQRQWRTPPLWGVADSAPYLHDGRSRTLDDAIRKHGGEARSAREKYAALSGARRQRLLAFLGSVGVPATAQ